MMNNPINQAKTESLSRHLAGYFRRDQGYPVITIYQDWTRGSFQPADIAAAMERLETAGTIRHHEGRFYLA